MLCLVRWGVEMLAAKLQAVRVSTVAASMMMRRVVMVLFIVCAVGG